MNPNLLRIADVAALAGISTVSVRQRIKEGRLPEPLDLGGLLRWNRESVKAALDEELSLVDVRGVMEMFNITRPTIRSMVAAQKLPEPVRRGQRDFWRRAELESVIAGTWEPEVQADAASPFGQAPVDKSRMEKIGRDLALAGQKFSDDFDMMLEEKAAGAQRQTVMLNVVTEADGKRWVDIRLGEELIEAFGLVTMPDGQHWVDFRSEQEDIEAFGLVIRLAEGERRAALPPPVRN